MFLAGPRSGPADEQRYDSDVQLVSSSLAGVGADVTSSSQLEATSELVADLPVYTRLVGTALADSRQNLPVGAAYLREASALMRTRLLPAARQVHDAETADLTRDGAAGSANPLAELALLVACLAALAVVQVFVSRRTNRVINPGLAVATCLVLAGTLWAGVATPAERAALAGAATHQRTADALVTAELAAVQAHGDELLSLAARGEDQGTYEHDFASISASLTGMLAAAASRTPGLTDARTAQQSWLADHRNLVALESDSQGDNSANAQVLLQLTGPGQAGSGPAFVRVNTDLRTLVTREENGYHTDLDAARSELTGLATALAILTAVALAAATVGINQRLREYR